ncbi:MAG: hypothetical protein LBU97_01045 [Alistipes sp.]|jgi:hypothetical protein|nr:hypothetical protein [Alistipes sp.]
MRKSIFFTLAAIAMAAVGCVDLDPVPCIEVPGPFSEQEDLPFDEYYTTFYYRYDPDSPFNWVNVFQEYDVDGDGAPDRSNTNQILAINSDEEMRKYSEGEYPPIDFSQKTLLLAYGSANLGLYHDLRFQQISARNYVVSFNYTGFTGAVSLRWIIAIVVDKLPLRSNFALIYELK